MAQRFLIFGASGGIGSALVELLHQQGHQLVVSGRDRTRLQPFCDRGLAVAAVTGDVGDSKAVEAVVASAKQTLGELDGIAHCVGSLWLKPLHLTSDSDWAHHLAVNLTSAFYVLRAAAKHHSKQLPMSVVLVSSVAARFGLPNHEVIAAAKGGIIGLVQSAAATYAASQLRVNAVAPGLIATPLTQALTSTPAMAAASAALHPVGYIGKPSDPARLIAFLLDLENNFINGQIFGVDGGMSRVRPTVTSKSQTDSK